MKPHALAVAPAPSRLADLFVLTKVRLNALVVATAVGGYYLAAPDGVSPFTMLIACVGTALVASGAAAINQVSERDIDRQMERTRFRPIADHRMSVTEGYLTGAALAVFGVGLLWLGANALAALVAFTTLAIYVWIYTPLKRRTSLSTIVGAVPGALPPLIGWAAARGTLEGLAPWTLFLVMFLWQLPHFLAIAWMCRDDYRSAGLPMLSVVDTDGSMTGRQAALWAATLIPFSLLPFVVVAKAPFAAGALALGFAFFAVAVRFAVRRTDANARLLFFGSITYLPLLWTLMCVARR
ncbi:MAG TPA: heme o synthase [Vicinamibacterales bacterium]|nr:heme o synthase [Vicinamibacterales bacterium]